MGKCDGAARSSRWNSEWSSTVSNKSDHHAALYNALNQQHLLEKMVTADDEMAGRRRRKSKVENPRLTGLRHSNSGLLSAFRAYEETCINALSDLEEAVFKHHIDQEAQSKSSTC